MANEGPHRACVDMDCVFAWASQLCPRQFRFFHPQGTSATISSPNIDSGAHGKRLCDAVYAFHEPQEQVDVEIVFIHGLEFDGSKDAYWKTWLARDGTQDTCWPETWLAEKFPHARILSLSYDANVEKTSTSGRTDLYSLGESLVPQMTSIGIGQHECPVLFVCHSFGGLVAKQIVVTASQKFQREQEFQNFLRNLRGFYFYATPHGGAQLHFSPLNPFTSRGSCMSYLKVFSPEVGRLNSEFDQIRYEVYNNEWMCFNVGEMHSTLLGGVVVPESSARQVGGRFLPINANHFGICRPRSKIDTSYQSLTNWVSKVIKVHEDKQRHQLDLPNGLVGMDDKIQIVCEKLGVVSIFGLVGMGGIGKTTISKCVYNSQAKSYEKTCFLQDVRSKSVASVQKELLEELCGVTLGGTDSVTLNHLQKIKQCVMGKRVLLVIDDVEDSETLKSLQVFAFQRSLGNGSRVIVTCRNRQVLENHVCMERLKDVEIMDVEFLNDIEALELFHYHVFGGIEDEDDEMEAFQVLAKDVAKACCGLPLSLEVIGQHLRKQHVHSIGMRKGMWEEALRKLHEAESFDGGDENEVLWKRLKISYDDLSLATKSMFLDFACFFCEKASEDLSEESIGWIWNSPIGLQNLLARSLIKVGGIDEFGRFFTIHDQLRDMGRRIVKDLSLERLHGSLKIGSRLWEAKDVVSFLEENEGSRIVEGISLRHCLGLATLQSLTDGGLMGEMTAQRVKGLRLLDLARCRIELVEFCLRKCWKELSWLCLDGIWDRNDTVMPHSIEAIGFCTGLRVLQMRHFSIEELPASIGNLVDLLELDLTGCWRLKSLPFEIGHLKRLKRLKLERCRNLKEVHACVSQLTDLEYLGLQVCSNLVSMVEFETQMDHLYELNLNGCRSLRIPFKSLGKLHQLRTLDMRRCKGLVIENPSESFGHLSRLEKLNLRSCDSLIPGFHHESFAQEEVERLWKLVIESFSSRLQKLVLPAISQVGFLPHSKLKDLKVYNGFHLKELPASLGNFTHLKYLKVIDDGLGFLKKLPDSLCSLVKLEVLKLSNVEALESLPNNLGHLSSLKTLEFCGMLRNEELPASIGQLSQLQKLFLVRCTRLKCLPESFTSLTQLAELTLRDCRKLMELPTSLGQLSQLEVLDLVGCVSLKRLPKSSTSLIRLSILNLSGCNTLKVEDEDQKFLLQELEQHGCKIFFQSFD